MAARDNDECNGSMRQEDNADRGKPEQQQHEAQNPESGAANEQQVQE